MSGLASEEVPIMAMPPRSIPSWIEQSIWTSRMVACLEVGGPRGGKWYSLIDKVFSFEALEAGYARVSANQGAPGIDRQSVKMFGRRLVEEIQKLQWEWSRGKYRPQPVLRSWIPKPGSKERRPLGIPTVRDRVVQASIKLVLEPIFEATFYPHSYGFRPGRKAQDALGVLCTRIREGHGVVVDADFRSFFDTIPHDRLRASLETKISDGRLLDLIDQFLQARIADGNELLAPEAGTPQGGVLSPLLANIYLNDLDWHLSGQGLEVIRYADDFVVLCKTKEEGARALETIRSWTESAGLTLHPDKTRMVDIREANETFEFLGFRFKRHIKGGRRQLLRLVRSKSLAKVKDSIRQHTPRNSGHSLTHVIKLLNRTLRGWHKYFRTAHASVHEKLDAFTRRRLRSIQSRRRKRTRHGRGNANLLWPNAFFAKLGLLSLRQAHLEYSHSRKGTR